MQTMMRAVLCAVLFAGTQVHGSTVSRCEDSQGRITYSQHGCPQDQGEQIIQAHNTRPSGSGPSTEMARESGVRTPLKEFQTRGIGPKDDGCGNQLDSRTRRESIIKGRVRAGMSQSDVESALGKPERTSSQNGTTRFHYQTRSGRSQQVTFDENGCVKTKR